jgi:hypothetical protein
MVKFRTHPKRYYTKRNKGGQKDGECSIVVLVSDTGYRGLFFNFVIVLLFVVVFLFPIATAILNENFNRQCESNCSVEMVGDVDS